MKNNSPASPKIPNITWRIHLLSVSGLLKIVWPPRLLSLLTVVPVFSVSVVFKSVWPWRLLSVVPLLSENKFVKFKKDIKISRQISTTIAKRMKNLKRK